MTVEEMVKLARDSVDLLREHGFASEDDQGCISSTVGLLLRRFKTDDEALAFMRDLLALNRAFGDALLHGASTDGKAP